MSTSTKILLLVLVMLEYAVVSYIECEDISQPYPTRSDCRYCTKGICLGCKGVACGPFNANCCDTAPYCHCGKCSTELCVGQGHCCESLDDCCDGLSCIDGQCISLGRPYNVVNMNETLRANIITHCNINHVEDKYIDALLSEHASIGTFNKFCIELMNLGAPLWIIELSQKASLDEINHTKIMLNIINNLNGDNNECVEIGRFPNHEIQIDGDCNKISLDVVNGGCFGETVSIINIVKQSFIFKELYYVTIDEVRHSSLGWVAAKWMINNCKNIQISQYEFWQNKFSKLDNSDDNNIKQVITKIFNVFWDFKGKHYQTLYQIIHDMLKEEVNIIAQNP